MALQDLAFYYSYGDGSTTGYYAVTKWAINTVKNCGDIVRQNATPTVGNQRCFVCIVGGTTNATTEPVWVLTRGAKSPVDGTVTWMEATGIPALNGDKTNMVNWTAVKNTAVSLGQVIISGDGTKILICTTAGTAGNAAEPTWAAYTTAGATTADNTVTWTTLKDLSNTYTAWASPAANLAALCATGWAVAGTTVFAADNSVEDNLAGITVTVQMAAAKISYLYSIDHLASLPPSDAARKKGATLQVTTSTAPIAINSGAAAGSAYIDGFIFNTTNSSASGVFSFNSNTGGAHMVLKNSSVVYRTTAATENMTVGATTGNTTVWDNVTMTFAAANQIINVNSSFTWRNTSSALLGTPMPPQLLTLANSNPIAVLLEGLDLSALTTAIFSVTPGAGMGYAIVKDCKLNASTALCATSLTSNGGPRFQMLRSDNGNTNYKTNILDAIGTMAVETTIVRTGGATDGTTALSWKIITTANSLLYSPFITPDIRIWNDKAGTPVTCTVYGIWGGAAVPNISDIYLDVEYLGTASFPQGNFISNGPASSLAAAAAQGADTSTWGGSTTPFKMQVTFTPQYKGYLSIRVKAVKPSTTFYIDPKPVLT